MNWHNVFILWTALLGVMTFLAACSIPAWFEAGDSPKKPLIWTLVFAVPCVAMATALVGGLV